MKPATQLWPISAMLISLWTCDRAHAAPFPLDSTLVGHSRPLVSPATTPSSDYHKREPEFGAKGFYNTRLDPDGHCSVQPFPTDISYITFRDHPGEAHLPVPHLDIAPAGFNLDKSNCWYHEKPCPGIPHIPSESAKSSSIPLHYPPRPTTSGGRITVTGATQTRYMNATSTVSCVTPGTSISNTASPSQSISETTIPSSTAATEPTMSAQDVFRPISTDAIPNNIQSRDDHFVKKNFIENAPGPISTNKFYANFFLGSQTNATFTHPYSVAWAKGNGPAKSFGLAISHIEENKRAMGDPSKTIPGNPMRYFINPIGIQSVILSATELGGSTTLGVSKPEAFSAEAVLRPQAGRSESITFPVVQGMGFVTGIYNNLQPAIQTGVFFRKIEGAGSPKNGVFKYRILLEDDANWLLYVIPDNGADPKMEHVSNSLIRGPKGFKGIIQVTKNPSGGNGEKIYDRSCAAYAKTAKISGSVSGNTGTYKLSWDKAGKDSGAPLVMFALPHHVASFDDATKNTKTEIKLITTTKGMATAHVGNSWTMVEKNLPTSMDFAPWKPGMNARASLSTAAKQAIKAVAGNELSQNMDSQTNLDSMYFSGKALAKFASAIYAIHELVGDRGLAAEPLNVLKRCFARFVDNKQKNALVYDTVWKGVVSSGTYKTGDPGLDFGNTLYNDHHFHYGYFILSAAIIGKLDPNWLNANKAWVNMLVRDAADSVSDDKFFPFSRGFDWFHGHSWAKGLFESLDGKDQESTSEDSMFAYAIKMWGKTIGDKSMEARGNLMLGILARSFDNYFLMRKSNVNQPRKFIDNKVTGILFENKIDHATYFGMNLEYIQGIHMLPLLPNSAYTRRADFVREEWDAMFAANATLPADRVQGGWKGVLFANLAIIDPEASWRFFSQDRFDLGWIDGGASRVWYMAYAAGAGLAKDCVLPAAAFPPPTNLGSSVTFKKELQTFTEEFRKTLEGPLDGKTTSFSINLFSTSDKDTPFYDFHHLATEFDGLIPDGGLNGDTVYRAGSISKVATVYAFLVEAGIDRFDEKITKFIPELAAAARKNGKHSDGIDNIDWDEVTISALAGYVAGVIFDSYGPDIVDYPPIFPPGMLPAKNYSQKCGVFPTQPLCTRKEFFHGLLELPAIYPTFTAPVYSNTGFGLIGLALERITGRSFEATMSKLYKSIKASRSTFDYRDVKDSQGIIPGDATASMWNARIGIEKAFGRAILDNTLIPASATRRWLRPTAFTARSTESVGAPWEIYRLKTNNRLVDLYTKRGGIGRYASHLILVPDYNIGISVMVAGIMAAPQEAALSELLVNRLVPAFEREAAIQASKKYDGTYKANNLNSTIVFETADNRPGIGVKSWISNGTDVLAALNGIYSPGGTTPNLRVYPRQLTNKKRGGSQEAFMWSFEAVPIDSASDGAKNGEGEPIFTGTCPGWGNADFTLYSRKPLSQMIFNVDRSGKVTGVEASGFHVTMHKQ
ncbi:hypothetical protein FQN57_007451 [Myotisia sp. PD_48]|nr:hypothetical protein FQN57_007451 [Myotisia sp. PD_48]